MSISFQIGGRPFPQPDNKIQFNLERITKPTGRSADGTLEEITSVNNIATFRLEWSKLSADDMQLLCNLCGAIIPNFDNGEAFPVQVTTDRIAELTTILPVGVRTIQVYIGDRISATLSTKKQFDDNLTYGQREILENGRLGNWVGGNWEDYVIWENVSIDIVGIGHKGV